MCTIIFIAKIPLQFQIKPELHEGLCPHWTHYHGSASQARNETLVTALFTALDTSTNLNVKK
jgi:hypothetical protein